MKKTILLIASTTFFLFSCGGEEEIEVEKTAEIKKYTLTAEDSIPAEPTRLQGISHSGNYGYRTDSLNQYSAGVVENLNDTLVNSSIRICVDLWIKSSNPLKGDGFAISCNIKDASVFWGSFDIVNYGAKANEWVNIKDSVTLRADQFSEPGMIVKLFGFNANKKSTMDLDDINITFKKVYTVSE